MPSTKHSLNNFGTLQEDALDWEGFQTQIQSSLDKYFLDHGARAQNYSPAFAQLWASMSTATRGGKWMRPRLVFLTYSAFGGVDHQACGDLAAAFEILHAALLVHDDVIDRDFCSTRRCHLGCRVPR